MSESTIRAGEVGKKGKAGIFGDKLGSKWEGAGFGQGGLFGGEDNDLVLGNWTLICFNRLPAVFGLDQDQS